MDLQLADKRIVVGGGSGALGAEVCNVLSQEGARVQSADIINDVDLSDSKRTQEYFAQLQKSHGKLYGYCSCVWGGNGASLTKQSPGDREEVMRHTLDAVINPVLESIKLMKETGGGRIVLVSSLNASMGYGEGMYDVAKSALNALPTTLMKDCAKHNIHMMAISPPTIGGTPSWNATPERTETLKMIDGLMPDGKVVTVQEIARVIAFLFSPWARVFNGNNLIPDAGYRFWRPDLNAILEQRGE